jgi:hypothetical protein
VLGGTCLSPLFGKQEENWLPAGTLTNLPEHDPMPVTLRVAREDGYNQVIAARTSSSSGRATSGRGDRLDLHASRVPVAGTPTSS